MDRSKSPLFASAYALYAHFILQLIAGGLLATVYRGNAAEAHASTTTLHQGLWAYLQAFHYWGSSVMIVHATLHFAAVTWAGWYRGPLRWSYLASFALMLLSLGFQLSGNVLSWDRHGVQTAAVEGAIAARVPAVGPTISHVMMGGDGVSEGTLGVWYLAHKLLFPIAFLLVLALGIVPLNRESSREGKWRWAIPAVVALLLAVFIAAPFGSAATPDDFSRFDAKPSWYTVPMHGLLVWGDRLVNGGGWIGSALLPALFGAALVGLAFLKKPKPTLGRGMLAAFGVIGVLAALTSGGEVASLVGTRDPKVHTVAMHGPVGAPKNDVLLAKGKTLFADNGCAGCHGENGLKGVTGPSLKDIWKEHPEPDFYEKYVKNPASVSPGSTMPAYPQLKDDELRAIAEFLRFERK